METKVLNYRIIIEPDQRTGTDEPCFTAYCSTLGLADSGDTLDEALTNIKKAIKIWLETLTKDGQEIPPEDEIEGSFVTVASIKVRNNIRQAYL